MKIKNPISKKYLDIHSARLTFKKGKNNHVSDEVYVTIYYKKSLKKRKDFPVPEDINTDELNWKKGKSTTIYYRTTNYSHNIEGYSYIDSGGITVPTNLGQKLENLVNIACFENSEKK